MSAPTPVSSTPAPGSRTARLRRSQLAAAEFIGGEYARDWSARLLQGAARTLESAGFRTVGDVDDGVVIPSPQRDCFAVGRRLSDDSQGVELVLRSELLVGRRPGNVGECEAQLAVYWAPARDVRVPDPSGRLAWVLVGSSPMFPPLAQSGELQAAAEEAVRHIVERLSQVTPEQEHSACERLAQLVSARLSH